MGNHVVGVVASSARRKNIKTPNTDFDLEKTRIEGFSAEGSGLGTRDLILNREGELESAMGHDDRDRDRRSNGSGRRHSRDGEEEDEKQRKSHKKEKKKKKEKDRDSRERSTERSKDRKDDRDHRDSRDSPSSGDKRK